MRVLCVVGVWFLAANAANVGRPQHEERPEHPQEGGRPPYPGPGEYQPQPYPMHGNYPPPYPQQPYEPKNETAHEGHPRPQFQGHPGMHRPSFPQGPPRHMMRRPGPPGPPPPPPAFIIQQIISQYCKNPVLQKCLEENLEISEKQSFLATPEVIALNSLFIRSMGAKKVLDIGCFTGASSLAAALVLPQGGKVVACDVSEPYTTKATAYWKEAKVSNKIELVLAPVLETLKKLLAQGEAGTFDFAFVDHDLLNYDHYYELCLKLVRRGGMIVFDSRLTMPSRDKAVAEVLQGLADKMDTDKRVTVLHSNINVCLVYIN